jgi:hypothetical protein
MCAGLQGRYTLEADRKTGACSVPARTSLVVTAAPHGYALEAAWLRGCVMRALREGSCKYEARCEAIVGGTPQPVVLRVTRNASGFYGPVEIASTGAECTLQVSTGAP